MRLTSMSRRGAGRPTPASLQSSLDREKPSRRSSSSARPNRRLPDHVHKYQISRTDMSKKNEGRPSLTLNPSATESGEEYKVGPGRPPREYQFKPGQSGNPKGAKRKPRSLLPDLKRLFE